MLFIYYNVFTAAAVAWFSERKKNQTSPIKRPILYRRRAVIWMPRTLNSISVLRKDQRQQSGQLQQIYAHIISLCPASSRPTTHCLLTAALSQKFHTACSSAYGKYDIILNLYSCQYYFISTSTVLYTYAIALIPVLYAKLSVKILL